MSLGVEADLYGRAYVALQERNSDQKCAQARGLLHDWDANFSFVKAQNGNFSFTFNVQLRANADIKLDYEQRDLLQNRPPRF